MQVIQSSQDVFTSFGGNPGNVFLPFSTKLGSTIAVSVMTNDDTKTLTTVSDGTANVYTVKTLVAQSGGTAQIAYCENALSLDREGIISFTYNSAPNEIWLMAWEVEPCRFDQYVTGTATSGHDVVVGPIVTPVSNCFALACCQITDGVGALHRMSVSGGFTLGHEKGGGLWQVSDAYQIVSSPSSITCTFTDVDTITSGAAAMATFAPVLYKSNYYYQ